MLLLLLLLLLTMINSSSLKYPTCKTECETCKTECTHTDFANNNINMVKLSALSFNIPLFLSLFYKPGT